jgi:molybdenum cofactor biosynthesis enzyme MoaA
MKKMDNKISSLSLFVGTGKCNANCVHCAGKPLRKFAPVEDGIIDEFLIYKTIRDCHAQGAKYLSLSSSGEPTLSPLAVTKVLCLINQCTLGNIYFNPINLYSNGIRIGEDAFFCNQFLSLWKSLGLTSVYITVHDVNEKINAEHYGIDCYPPLDIVFNRVHASGLKIRANLVLNKNTIDSLERYVYTAKALKEMKADMICSWCIRNQEDKVDQDLSLPEKELDKIQAWVESQDGSVRLLREGYRKVYEQGEKLTLFPDGKLSNSWCR